MSVIPPEIASDASPGLIRIESVGGAVGVEPLLIRTESVGGDISVVSSGEKIYRKLYSIGPLDTFATTWQGN